MKRIFIFLMFVITVTTFGLKEYYEEGIPYTGNVITSDNVGNKVDCNYKDGKLHGSYKSSAPDGRLVEEYTYDNGVLIKGIYHIRTETTEYGDVDVSYTYKNGGVYANINRNQYTVVFEETRIYDKETKSYTIKKYYDNKNLKEEMFGTLEGDYDSLKYIAPPAYHINLLNNYYENSNLMTEAHFDKESYKIFGKLYSEDGILLEESSYNYEFVTDSIGKASLKFLEDGNNKKYDVNRKLLADLLYKNGNITEGIYYYINGNIWKEYKYDKDNNKEYVEYYVDRKMKEYNISAKDGSLEIKQYFFNNGNADHEIHYSMGKIIRDISYYYDGKKYIDILYDSFDKSIKKEYSRDNNLQFLTDQINGNGSRIKYEKDGITEFKDDSKDYDMDFSVGSGNDNDPNHDMLYYSNYQLQFERYLNRNPIVIKQYAKNGVPSIDYEVSYENDNVKNIGYYKSYHGNGQLSFETTYNEDEKENGIHRTYYKNAVLESEKYYENGILKTEKTYYENGLLKSEYAGGTKQHTEYDEHGEKIKIEQTASNTSNISEPINFPTREEVQSMQRQEKTSEIGEKIIYYITIAIMTIVIGILMKRIYNSKKNNKFNQGKKNKNNNKKKF